MQPRTSRLDQSTEPPLSREDLVALQEACGPVGLLTFPPIGIIQKLRQQGYVTIVLGGIQITPQGLERLLRERERTRSAVSNKHASSIG